MADTPEASFVARVAVNNDIRPFLIEMAQSLGMELGNYFIHIMVEHLQSQRFKHNSSCGNYELYSEMPPIMRGLHADFLRNSWPNLLPPVSNVRLSEEELSKIKRDKEDAIKKFLVEPAEIYKNKGEVIDIEFDRHTAIYLASVAKHSRARMADYIMRIVLEKLERTNFDSADGKNTPVKYSEMIRYQRDAARKLLLRQQAAK